MSNHTSGFENPRRLVESATRPIEPPWRTLAALLLFAGKCLLPRRALPAHTMTAHSGASNCGR